LVPDAVIRVAVWTHNVSGLDTCAGLGLACDDGAGVRTLAYHVGRVHAYTGYTDVGRALVVVTTVDWRVGAHACGWVACVGGAIVKVITPVAIALVAGGVDTRAVTRAAVVDGP